MKKARGILTVVSGFSGAGKGTLMRQLMQTYDNYALSVSMTTRSPRDGEVDGREYFFITNEEFESHIKNNELLEYAKYVEHYYGTPKAYVEEQLNAGKDVILEIEIQGALKIKEQFHEALLLFVMPPSAEELKKRLIGRGTETIEVINKRLLRAKEEAKGIDQYEYMVINDDLSECAKTMHEMIQSAKFKTERNEAYIEKMKKELSEITKGDR